MGQGSGYRQGQTWFLDGINMPEIDMIRIKFSENVSLEVTVHSKDVEAPAYLELVGAFSVHLVGLASLGNSKVGGQEVHSSFHVKMIIGARAFGRVHHLWNPNTDTAVAIKSPKKDLTHEFIQRWKEEARIQSLIDHVS